MSTSWVASANGHSDFPLQNLPFGVFRRAGSAEAPRVGVAIGDDVLDVAACLAAGLLDDAAVEAQRGARACASPSLNALMALGSTVRRALRDALMALLSSDVAEHKRLVEQHALVAQREAEMFLPVQVGDYTDFYASVHHATNVGSMFRPDNPLLPNYKWVPIGYHGRASSIVVSDTPVARPNGQRKGPDDAAPTFGASRLLDYELELGAFVGTGNPLGSTIPLSEVENHLWGLCLLNDWSARDIQSWEYQPLGPFLAKNFASTISPWVVTLEALEPFRAPLAARADGDPAPLPYLTHESDQTRGGFSLTLEVWLETSRMRAAGEAPVRISRGSSLDLYWSFGQMLAHHASNGCNMRSGDLLGSGTISGASKDSRGCLLELTWRGAEPITLPNGEQRKFLEDGDTLSMTAYAEREGAVRIGFGWCRGTIAVPSVSSAS
ncbi:MAG: fumarylacetoacetase [Gemmatimonadaceae bacterium]|nr:fumarylacetoacetase [Gemmatimonadaceae bacterium]